VSARAAAFLLCVTATLAHADPAAWHVSDEQGGELWLLGSVHYLRETDHPLPAVVDELYASADALAMELDLDDLDPAELQGTFLAAAMLSPGRTLEDVLGSEVYRHARARSQALGIELRLLAQFEPWLVAVTLMDVGMTQMGFRPEHGLEQTLLRRAQADAKPVRGLESLATQVDVFDGLPMDAQRALLEQTLAELESPSEMMHELVAAWRDGSLDALSSTLMQDFEQFPGLYDALVVERNRRWIDTLETLLTSGERHLVIVGALHLVGEDSVVALLAERGLTVAPIP
jgi:uncharacterized protein YbaP (TraB family)